MDYPGPVQNLITQVARLPGIGKRSAERIALHLLKADGETNRQLAQSILDAKARIRNCSRCGSYTEHDPCEICASPRRDQASICVVEGPNDILTLERAGIHKGVYHALMGRISPLNGIGPEKLRVAALLERVKRDKPTEVILALGADVESEATTNFLIDELKPLGVAVSRIALGLSAGSALETADEVTLARALEGRRRLQ
ncbi:MAG TPA: recombination mediator RecR [Verrucomicrobiae bacterium]|nr:recombination mediator RecR [Verrucomicrobiae bacterium]